MYARLRVLSGFISFSLHRRLRYEPYGPWSHFPPSAADPIAPESGSPLNTQGDIASSSNDQSFIHPESEVVLQDPAHEGAVVEAWSDEDDESMVVLRLLWNLYHPKCGTYTKGHHGYTCFHSTSDPFRQSCSWCFFMGPRKMT
jgi:hypothetical protein